MVSDNSLGSPDHVADALDGSSIASIEEVHNLDAMRWRPPRRDKSEERRKKKPFFWFVAISESLLFAVWVLGLVLVFMGR